MVGAPVRSGTHRTAVVWFRRDLRLSDHPVLAAALAEFDRVVPLFVWDRYLVERSGVPRLAFLHGCVAELGRHLGGELVVRQGEPPEAVAEVAAACGAEAVCATADFGPYGMQRDREVAVELAGRGMEWRPADSPYAVAPGILEKEGGGGYQVFSAFHRAWSRHSWGQPRRKPTLSRVSRAGLDDRAGPDPPVTRATLPAAGETEGRRLLDRFLRSALDGYGGDRDLPALDSTSRLSPYLKFGCLHPRQILSRLESGSAGHDRFAAELCWRDFFADVLFRRPDAARVSYRPEWSQFQVDEGGDADRRFAAWAEGRTGYPMVDAGMRQLLAEGWMHNRVRMITASFLVKDLHLDWRRGARWFMEHLVDGDLASNQLNWQWVAGSGTDAAPFFRVFNPVGQGTRYDPRGDYVRKWIPELAEIPGDTVHEPWRSRSSLFGTPGTGYPDPIVEHAEERREALARFGRLRSQRRP